MNQKIFKLMPGGDTSVEKLYTLFRYHVGKIAKRVRTRQRCRKCFTRGFIGCKWTVKHGCDGCAEMETFIETARDAFAREAIEDGKGVKG